MDSMLDNFGAAGSRDATGKQIRGSVAWDRAGAGGYRLVMVMLQRSQAMLTLQKIVSNGAIALSNVLIGSTKAS